MLRDVGYWDAVIGQVVDAETGKPLAGMVVLAYDKDVIKDDYLGKTTTDKDGRFRIEFPQRAFQGAMALTEGAPDIYLKVTHPDGRHMKTKVRYDMEGDMEPTSDQEKGGPDGEIEILDMGRVEFR